MSSLRPVSFTILATILSSTACVGSPEDDLVDGDLTVSLEPLGGPIGANGMSPLDFWAPSNQAALRSLGLDEIAGPGSAIVDTALLDTAGGRSVLDYVVRCALPTGTTLYGDGGLELHGQIGLAPAWADRGLTTSEQRWMTACLLQHLNGLGQHVDIVLDGAHAALAAVPGVDISEFTVEDATMFGNVFVSGATAYACINLEIELTCGLDLGFRTLERICGLSPTCGVTFLGLCGLHCSYSNGNPTCHFLLGPTYTQAIQTRVRDTDLLELYPGCGVL